MSIDTRQYALGTELTVSYPWGWNIAGRALCPDGKVRRLARISQTADTFFSIPAAVQVGRKTVSGYVTIETVAGMSTATDEDPAVLKFITYTYGKNADAFGGAS